MKRRVIISTGILLLMTIVSLPLVVALHSHVHHPTHHVFSQDDQLLDANSQCSLCDFYFHKAALRNSSALVLPDCYVNVLNVIIYDLACVSFFSAVDLRGPPNFF